MSNVVDFDSAKNSSKTATDDQYLMREAMQIAANLPPEQSSALMVLALATCFVRLLHNHAT
jgi:hypothetical protein